MPTGPRKNISTSWRGYGGRPVGKAILLCICKNDYRVLYI